VIRRRWLLAAVSVPLAVGASFAACSAVTALGDRHAAGVFEPGHRRFTRDVASVLEHVLPLPDDLSVVRRWEDCGQGGDPMCGAVVLLVDDQRHDAAPTDAVVAHLLRSGWVLADDGNVETRFRHPSGGFADVEPLRARIDRGAQDLLFDDEAADADSLLYVAITPPG
jgi:hypothetical protein